MHIKQKTRRTEHGEERQRSSRHTYPPGLLVAGIHGPSGLTAWCMKLEVAADGAGIASSLPGGGISPDPTCTMRYLPLTGSRT